MTNSNNTIFDDVFRTMLTKIPELIIPLVNEVFDTSYPPDISITRYQNELYDHHQKKITDSHFGIAHIHYHAECQSTGDPTMHIRMLEYDTAIGLEYISCINGEFHISLPQSFVLYLSSTSRTVLPSINLHFTNNCSILYHPKPVYLPDYSLEKIFRKDLIFLLPFYIIRYRSRNSSGCIVQDSDDFQQLMNEYQSIKQYLTEKLYNEKKENLYLTIIELSNKIIDYIFADNLPARKGLGDIMGGQVLELATDRLVEESIQKGIQQGIETGMQQGIQKGMQQGIETGMQQGIEKGAALEREASIRTLIHFSHKNNIPRDNLIQQLITEYHLSDDDVQQLIARYWE